MGIHRGMKWAAVPRRWKRERERRKNNWDVEVSGKRRGYDWNSVNLFWCSPSCRNISGSPNNCLFGSGRGSPHVAMRSVSTVPDACDCDCDWQRELRVDRFAPDLQSTSTGMYKMYSTRSYHQQSIRNGRSFGRLVHIRLAGVFFPELSDAGRYRPPMGVTGKQWETVEGRAVSSGSTKMTSLLLGFWKTGSRGFVDTACTCTCTEYSPFHSTQVELKSRLGDVCTLNADSVQLNMTQKRPQICVVF